MSAVAAIGTGLQAALLMARGRAEGLALVTAETTGEMRAAARSFWAIAVCFPVFVCLHLADWAQGGLPHNPVHEFAAALLSYGIGWIGFAIISARLAADMGRAAQWPRYIAIWNWCNVVQLVILLIASIPSMVGLPDVVGETAWLVGMGWALWLEWFATRLALEISSLAAAGLVALDFALGVFLLSIIGA